MFNRIQGCPFKNGNTVVMMIDWYHYLSIKHWHILVERGRVLVLLRLSESAYYRLLMCEISKSPYLSQGNCMHKVERVNWRPFHNAKSKWVEATQNYNEWDFQCIPTFIVLNRIHLIGCLQLDVRSKTCNGSWCRGNPRHRCIMNESRMSTYTKIGGAGWNNNAWRFRLHILARPQHESPKLIGNRFVNVHFTSGLFVVFKLLILKILCNSRYAYHRRK